MNHTKTPELRASGRTGTRWSKSANPPPAWSAPEIGDAIEAAARGAGITDRTTIGKLAGLTFLELEKIRRAREVSP